MFGCRNVRALLAASVYEDLNPDQQAALDRHVERCAACRERQKAFAAMREAIAVPDPPEFTGNLVPILRQRIQSEPSPRVEGTPWRFALAGTMGALVVALFSYGVFVAEPSGTLSGAGQRVLTEAPVSPLTPYLHEVGRLAQSHDYAGAYHVLKDAVAKFGDDPLAGEAQLKLADLAFEDLHWYPEADAAYDRMQRDYRDALEKSPEMLKALRRWDLLAEARQYNYSPLYELDAARRQGKDGVVQLEKVIAHYPATYVAALAANDMTELIASEEGLDDRTLAMEHARDRCSDPTAVAQLNYEIANSYAENNDLDHARQFYGDAAQGANEAVAQLAQARLARLDDPAAE